MIKKENKCGDCESSGIVCLGKLCNYYDGYKVIFCDGCKIDLGEYDRIFKYNDKDYCEKCLIEVLKKDGIVEEI